MANRASTAEHAFRVAEQRHTPFFVMLPIEKNILRSLTIVRFE